MFTMAFLAAYDIEKKQSNSGARIFHIFISNEFDQLTIFIEGSSHPFSVNKIYTL